MAQIKNPNPIDAAQRDKGLKLLLENPKLTVAEVMEACGIEQSKRNRWAVQKWKSKVADAITWPQMVKLCPDSATLGGLLVDGFYGRMSELLSQIHHLENKLQVSEKKVANLEEDQKQLLSANAELEKKNGELEAQLEKLSKRGKAKTNIEQIRKLS